MKKIMFNDKYGLTKAVLEGRKTQKRCIVPESTLRKANLMVKVCGGSVEDKIIEQAPYCFSEEIAVAQCYFDCGTKWAREHIDIASDLIKSKGYNNKMFVSAYIMPHRIKISNIRVERLQDISDEDCLKEGLEFAKGGFYTGYNKETNSRIWLGNTPLEAFASLIDKTSGKGTWENNSYVFVYDFELVK